MQTSQLSVYEAVRMNSYEIYQALVCRGDVDQAISLAKVWGFSSALLIQQLARQVITMIACSLQC